MLLDAAECNVEVFVKAEYNFPAALMNVLIAYQRHVSVVKPALRVTLYLSLPSMLRSLDQCK